jgi:hypothetical protein
MTRSEGKPAWWSVSTTRAALRLLPPGGARERWRAELTAELWGLSRGEQLRHTAGVVSRAPALRASITSPDRVVAEDILHKPVRCRLGWHAWVKTSTSDGTSRYLRCRRCPKETDVARPEDFMGGGPFGGLGG